MTMTPIKKTHRHCSNCSNNTLHKVESWASQSRAFHGHMCLVCGCGEWEEEDHDDGSSGKYINFNMVENNDRI